MTTPFSRATDTWFRETFNRSTPVQEAGWPAIRGGDHSLLIAPTGSGKTLAAFLGAIDRLITTPAADHGQGYAVLYISPLKALATDVERNLRAPLAGVARTAARLGEPAREPVVHIRTGDTPQSERRRQARSPGDILVTTPESLYLLLGSQAGANLHSVHTVIVDEVHALAGNKRGAHLALSLERLTERCDSDPQRIGLSATVHPVEVARRFLGGDRDVRVIDTAAPPRLELEILAPEEPPTEPGATTEAAAPVTRDARLAAPRSAGPAQPPGGSRAARLEPRLLAAILEHRSTIVFVNSRGLCERLVQRLNEAWREQQADTGDAPPEHGPDLVAAHHGSVSHQRRAEIEDRLKTGRLRGIVATTSLELGIDMGAVDLVVMVESPGSVARGLQRAGRAGHGVGETSRALILPRFRGDLLECAVIGERMHAGALEPLAPPHNPLDVLAQQIVAMVCDRPRTVDAIHALVTRAAPWRGLSRSLLEATLDMLAGHYPSTEFADLRPWLAWDRARDELSPRRGAALAARLNAGTIPDRGLYGVHVGEGGPRIGELDEEMVFELKTGENLTLGASTWHVEAITRDRVLVSPAPGEIGKLPFWHGDGPGRPIELGRAIGATSERLARLERPARAAWLREHSPLSAAAIDTLCDYIDQQREATGALPSDRRIVVECFRDEVGDWRVCLLTPFGARVHAPWALALQGRLASAGGGEVQVMYTDDGIVLRLADTEELPQADALFPDPDDLEEAVTRALGQSTLFASTFRENAARALLLVRNRPGQRTPLWAQRLKSQQLLASVREYAGFPVVLETYRQVLADIFDLESLRGILRGVLDRSIRVHEVETTHASPFARGLVFAYVAAYIYEQDAPMAERRAQALTLDRGMLAELLGQAELRELIDPDALAELEAELAHRTDATRVHDADALHDLLRRRGDLTPAELEAACADAPGPWLRQLAAALRALQVCIAGEMRWIAAEDAALYRDALGVVPPPGLPAAFLHPPERPLEQLLRRHARSHGPFRAGDLAARYALPAGAILPVLEELERAGVLLRGEIRPGGQGEDWCELEILRRLKRRTLARLRHEAAAVDARALGRFLPAWQGVTDPGAGLDGLREALMQLEGVALPWSAWTQHILPMRLRDFSPDLLDRITASGEFVWVGAGALGQHDGRIRLLRRERAGALLEAEAAAESEAPDDAGLSDAPLAHAILAELERRGACFYMELERAARAAVPDARQAAIEAALWDQVWAGRITNDTCAPLRSLGQRRGRGRSRPGQGLAGGRWSRVAELTDPGVTLTERAREQTETLLARYGVISRDMARAEGLPGGFGRVYPVCRAMEDAGKLRRGHFVDGLSGAQFARAGAVDRLRALERDADTDAAPLWLAAVDPANPWGTLLPWPDPPAAAEGRLRRVPGALVALAGGEPLLYLPASGRQLFLWEQAPALVDADDPAALVAAAVRRLLAAHWLPRRRAVTIEQLNGEPVRQSRWEPALRAGGARREVRGLSLAPA